MDIRISGAAPTARAEQKPSGQRVTENDFYFTLKRLGDEGLASRLEKLVADVIAQGDRLSRHMDIRDMRVYRSMISEFIREIVTNSYRFTRENVLNRRGVHTTYTMVHRINRELDELAQELLKEEKDHMAILEKTGEIQGLLLDLLI